MTDWSSIQNFPTPSSVNDLIRCMREDYKSDVLVETNVESDPFKQFEKWFQRAKDLNCFEPHGLLLFSCCLWTVIKYVIGMMLATCTPNGFPSARVVLLRHFDSRGFVFYTNYNSRKGKELHANPNVAATFWWHESCVRIEGAAEKVCTYT